MSINSIEEVAAATTRPFWFQLYTMKDQDFLSRLIQRAKEANCSALVITLDLQVVGQRHKDLKNGLSAPPKLTPATIANLMTKWRWGIEMLGAKRRNLGNIVGHIDSDPSSVKDRCLYDRQCYPDFFFWRPAFLCPSATWSSGWQWLRA